MTLGFILREYFNGGVITHHLLADEDLPGFSNWWGLVTIPVLTWVVISLIHRRQHIENEVHLNSNNNIILKRFGFALTFGALISILWALNLEIILPYVILLPLVIALFRPVHLPECLLGFVLGMMYSFGGVLPIIIGLILVLLNLFVNKLMQGARRSFFI